VIFANDRPRGLRHGRLCSIRKFLEEDFDIKQLSLIGFDRLGQEDERKVRIDKDMSITIEADRKHIDMEVKDLNLDDVEVV
jgi:hypothetical protein